MIRSLIILSLFSCLPLGIAAAAELTLQQFINQLQQHDIQKEVIVSDLMQLRFNSDLNLPARQWLLEVSTNYGLELSGLPRTSTSSVQLTRNNPQTGTDVSVSYQKNNQIGRTEEVQTLSIEQSLIRNPLGRNYKVQQTQLNGLNEVQKYQVEEAYEDYMAERMNQYLNFVENYFVLKLSQVSLASMERLLGEVKLRLKKRVANQVDLDRVRIQVSQQKNSIYEIKRQLKEIVADLKFSLEENSSKNRELVPSEIVPYLSTRFDLDKELETFLNSSRSILLLDAQKNSNENQIILQQRELLPEARLIIGFNRDRSTRFRTTANRDEATVGLALDYALDNSRNKAELASARLAKLQASLSKKRIKKLMQNQLEGMHQQILIDRDQLQLLSKQVETSSRLIKGQRRNFTVGRADLRDLIDAESILVNSQITLLRKKISFAQTIISWLRMTDQLVPK